MQRHVQHWGFFYYQHYSETCEPRNRMGNQLIVFMDEHNALCPSKKEYIRVLVFKYYIGWKQRNNIQESQNLSHTEGSNSKLSIVFPVLCTKVDFWLNKTALSKSGQLCGQASALPQHYWWMKSNSYNTLEPGTESMTIPWIIRTHLGGEFILRACIDRAFVHGNEQSLPLHTIQGLNHKLHRCIPLVTLFDRIQHEFSGWWKKTFTVNLQQTRPDGYFWESINQTIAKYLSQSMFIVKQSAPHTAQQWHLGEVLHLRSTWLG